MEQEQAGFPAKKKKGTSIVQMGLILLVGVGLLCTSDWLGILGNTLARNNNPHADIVSLVAMFVGWAGIGLIWSVVGPPLKRLWFSLRGKKETKQGQ